MGQGRSFHRALRGAPIAISVADMTHAHCRWCGKVLPDDWSEKRKYCSGACQARASRARNPRPRPGHRRKLTDAQLVEIRMLCREQGWTHKAAADRFGVNKTTVEHIVNKGVVDTRS